MPEPLIWQLAVTFSETEHGWVLSELTVDPEAGPGVFAALAELCGRLALADGPIRGGYWSGST